MKEFFKKYWTHILSLGFLICAIVLILILNVPSFNISLLFATIGILLLLVIGVWVEIIYSIVHAVKQKEIKNNGLCAIACYFLNIIYIPCYSLKYISKDKNYKKKNTIYLVVSILLFVFLIVLMVKLSFNLASNPKYADEYVTYTSEDRAVSFKLPYNYFQIDIGEFDLYFKNAYTNIGVFIYDDTDYTADQLLKYHEQQFLDNQGNMILIDSNTKSIKDKFIKTNVYEGIYNNNKNIYKFSMVTFTKNPNYKIYVLESILKENYNSKMKELNIILENIDLHI